MSVDGWDVTDVANERIAWRSWREVFSSLLEVLAYVEPNEGGDKESSDGGKCRHLELRLQ